MAFIIDPRYTGDMQHVQAGIQAEFIHGSRQPMAIPIDHGLNAGQNCFFRNTTKKTGEPDYLPVEGDSVSIKDGPRQLNHIIASGAWRLMVGDRPVIGMRLRSAHGAYALPAFVDGLGVGGELRLVVKVGGRDKSLEAFSSIDAILSPGSARWQCSDGELGVQISLEIQHLEEIFGFVATATVASAGADPVELLWSFSKADLLKADGGRCEYRWGTFTRILLGSASGNSGTDGIRETLRDGATSRLLCVWGYDDYDGSSVSTAYQRLKYRPFPADAWVAQMKDRWFAHWIGRGLEPGKRFEEALAHIDQVVEKARGFWKGQRQRVWVKTPDAAFDTAVRNTAATVISQFEYPCFMHGTDWTKYGKINCGYYGYNSSGYHEEVAESLRFLAGTQDLKGRMRYFSPAFAISIWCEEQDFYFVEQVWKHFCWTGDDEFLADMWPAVRRAIEHGIEASDPDGDGFMTAYYETWNCDTHARGGKCSLWTGMAASALRAAASIARRVNDIGKDGYCLDLAAHNQAGNERNPQQRYTRLAERSEAALAKLWNAEIGAYSSAEWNGLLRPRPSVMENNYILWRGAGNAMQKYMAMRFVRDNHHLKPADGVTMELMNDAWPILWSHHYVANGDTCMSVLCAAHSGDMDSFWPALKSVSQTLYTSDTATLTHGLLEDGRGSGMRQIIELEPQFLQATIDGVFGISADAGNNVMVIRPSLPSHWPEAAIRIRDVEYSLKIGESGVQFHVAGAGGRRVRAELPVRGAVRRVTLNGDVAKYSTRAEVNCCRVIVEIEPCDSADLVIETGKQATVRGSLQVHPNEPARFVVSGATIEMILDPQQALTESLIDNGDAVIRPRKTGAYTVFLELAAGDARWLHPLDLVVRERWEIVERFVSGFRPEGPSVASPALDLNNRTLHIELRNNTGASMSGPAVIEVAGHRIKREISIVAGGAIILDVAAADFLKDISPGSVKIVVDWNGAKRTATAVCWEAPAGATFASRLSPIDLREFYNAELSKLYHWDFQWRHDYTGCGVGVDWRDPMPPKDEKGYVLMTSPVAQLEYQSLPEGWVCQTRWETPALAGEMGTPFGISFGTAGASGPNVMALSATEPYEQLPSSAILRLPKPRRIEKVYLLSANLTKTIKSYYPGAEIVLHYSDGASELHSLVPPHSMPVFCQRICPRAHSISFGKIHGEPTPLEMGGNEPNLAVTDLLADASRLLVSMELRCVATETLLGIVGMTLLASPE